MNMIGRGNLSCVQSLKFEPEKDAPRRNFPILKLEFEQPTPRSTARSPEMIKPFRWGDIGQGGLIEKNLTGINSLNASHSQSTRPKSNLPIRILKWQLKHEASSVAIYQWSSCIRQARGAWVMGNVAVGMSKGTQDMAASFVAWDQEPQIPRFS